MGFQYRQGDRPLAGYTIQRGVGQGGFGEVYYAMSDGGKEVALKYLRHNPQVELRGAAHCLNLKSPHLVALHDIRENAEGDFFVIMEYVGGPSLRDLMNNEPEGLGAQKAAYFLREIGEGLAYLHDRGIVHRDLKPGNIFYEDGYVKIGDYGLAKIMATSQHSGQTVSVGTVHYMAPEVGSGHYDRTIDVYALGVVLYEMLLGRVPFAGATMGEVLMKHLTAQPEVNELPEPFPSVIRKALAKDPKDRYQTVNEMMAEVFAVQDVTKSVASLDPLNLTRMAAAVSKKVRREAPAGVKAGFGTGSSNVSGFRGPPAAPPPIVDRGGREPAPHAVRQIRDFVKGAAAEAVPDAASFPQRYRVTTGLLGLFLGSMGIHRFYTGHNTIGVLQILACFTGIGALWGMIEGLQILLNGDFKDALGRPLLENERVFEPGRRSAVARTVWGFFGLLLILTACGLLAGGTLAPPDWEGLGIESIRGPGYAVNVMHGMYLGAAAAFAFGVFATWKAFHRGGLTSWRATIRPGLLCSLLGVMGLALGFELCFGVDQMQTVALIVIGVAAVGFLFVWLLRGPAPPPRPGDAYWNRALANVFVFAGLLAGIGMLGGWRSWADEGYKFERPSPAQQTVSARTLSIGRGREVRWVTTDYSVAPVLHHHAPVIAGLCALLMFGAFAEASYRRGNCMRNDSTTSTCQ